jgi:hypothetical protein
MVLTASSSSVANNRLFINFAESSSGIAEISGLGSGLGFGLGGGSVESGFPRVGLGVSVSDNSGICSVALQAVIDKRLTSMINIRMRVKEVFRFKIIAPVRKFSQVFFFPTEN